MVYHPLSHYCVKGVPIKREHIRLFLAYGGAVAMGIDFVFTGFLIHHNEVAEHVCSNIGKCGASMSGFAVFFERVALMSKDM
jgi:hypothetical protein